MKLMIIRHGDPDYSIDSLTDVGWEEARLLARRMASVDVKAFYVSHLGRAQDTASVTLKKAGRTAETHAWMREYDVLIKDAYTGQPRLAWDLLPADWTTVPEFYDKDKWYEVPVMKEAGMKAGLDNVWNGLDAILEKHGYKRGVCDVSAFAGHFPYASLAWSDCCPNLCNHHCYGGTS